MRGRREAPAGGGPSSTRRSFLGLSGLTVGGAAAGGVLAGCTTRDSSGSPSPAGASPTASAPTVPAAGRHQAGVVTPQPPQPNLLLTVLDVDDASTDADIAALLRGVGQTILAVTTGSDPRLLGLPPGDLTITVGIGARLVARIDPSLPGATAMPRFDRYEDLAGTGADGDVVIQICASDPLVLAAADAAVTASRSWTTRWRQAAFRAQNVRVTKDVSAPRNLLGFVDGIVGPRTSAEFDADVWLRGPARVAGGTIMAVRRMEVDVHRFASLSVAGQERVFGRTRAEARPLSGGGIGDDPDLGAKTADGAYLIPADAHLRRANPAVTGVAPMLRRSYSFDGGLLFISFQNELRTFTATLSRMTTMDALLPYTRTTHTSAFLVLPGFSASRGLGASLLSE